MSKERRAYEIDKDTFILDSAGTAPEGKRMKRQADYSFEVVRGWFDTGALRIAESQGEEVRLNKDRNAG